MKSLDKSLTKETLKIYWKFTKQEWVLTSLAMAAVTLAALLQVFLPFLYKRMVDLLNAGLTPDTIRTGNYLIVLIGLVGVVTIIVRRFQDWSGIAFQPRVKGRLLNYCYEYLLRHSVNFFNNNFAGSLVRRVTRFDRAYEEISDQGIYMVGQTFIRMFFIVIAAAFRSWVFALVIFVWILLFVWVSYIFARRRMKYDLARAEQDSKVTGFLADTIGNVMNIKLFTGSNSERKQFGKHVKEQEKRLRDAWNAGLQADLVQGILLIVLEIAVTYTIFRLWQDGKATVGDFALAQAYVVQIAGRLWDFGRNVRRIYEALADANEMTEMLLTKHEVVDAPHATDLKVPKGGIVFDHVTFSYQGTASVFNDFNFAITPGERVALVGPSGGGKSTIVKMLLRFFDIGKGSILIDGQDIAKVTQDSLRRNVSLVPQEPILFHRTLMENIRYARPDATDDEVIQAARLAHCHEFIDSFPDKYNTFVGERGVKLSGGERQRVAIARAILKNAPILVLDEATSSLDSESEHLIQDAMATLMKGKTVIVIAHRLSTIMQMDRIIVLEDGQITEQGKHEELLKAKQGTYQKLWEIQAGGFAL